MIQSSAKPMVISYASPRNDRNFKRSLVSPKMGKHERSLVSPKMGKHERSLVSPKMGKHERSLVSPKMGKHERSLVSPKMGNHMIKKMEASETMARMSHCVL